LAAGRLNVAGFDAVQSLINANDALTAHFLGTIASLDHREAVRLHVDVVRIVGDASQRDVLKGALDGKRYPCMQCHVPQVNIPEAIKNTFRADFRSKKSKTSSNLLDTLNEGVKAD